MKRIIKIIVVIRIKLDIFLQIRIKYTQNTHKY